MKTIELAFSVDVEGDTKTGIEHDSVASVLRAAADRIEAGAWSHAAKGYAVLVNFPPSKV